MANQILLSVLVPSRERADLLKFSLDSLEIEKNNIEVLVWVDDDDPQLPEYRKILDGNPQVKLFIKKRVGYNQHYEMMNFLAENSCGDWLFLWNDDCYMDNANWYDKFINLASLSNPKEEPIVYNLWGQGGERNLFPIVNRKYYQLLGHISESPNWDAWIKRVAQLSRIHRHIFGIKPRHRKYAGDDKLGDLEDNTSKYVWSVMKSPDFNEIDKSIEAFTKDANIITDWIRNSTDRSTRVGFVGIGEQEFPVALAIESRGKNIMAYVVSPIVLQYIKEKEFPLKENRADEYIQYTKIETADSIESIVNRSNLIFCTVQNPDGIQSGDIQSLQKIVYFDHSHLKKIITDVIKAADRLEEKTTLVIVTPCLPGTFNKVIKPLLSPKINLLYNPLFLSSETPIQDFLNPKSVLIGSNNGDHTPLTNFYKI